MQYRSPFTVFVGITASVLIWLAAAYQLFVAYNRDVYGYFLTIIGVVIRLITLRPIPLDPSASNMEAEEAEAATMEKQVLPFFHRFFPLFIGSLLFFAVLVGGIGVIAETVNRTELVFFLIVLCTIVVLIVQTWRSGKDNRVE